MLKNPSSLNLFMMSQTEPLVGKRVSQRRSQRLLLRVPVVAQRQSKGAALAPETTETLAVNAHGALILLAPPAEEGEQLSVKNIKTDEEQICRVVYLGQIEGGRLQVGIEFKTPAPQFWRVSFPPEDWGPSTKGTAPVLNG